MSTESGSKVVALVMLHKDIIDHELAIVNNRRVQRKPLGDTGTRRSLAGIPFEVVTDPHIILALEADGRYITSSAASHLNLENDWRGRRMNAGEAVPPYEKFVSGTGFQLMADPSKTRVARLDRIVGERVPIFATKLIEDGYTVFDANYNLLVPKHS